MDKKTRAILVGCGGISRAWMRALQSIPEVEMVGLVDIVESAPAKLAEEFNLHVALGNDLGAMLDHVQPDVVFNCTVPEAHAEVALTSLRHGCHVLTEKPLADSMQNAHKMVEEAQKAGKVLAVIQNRRYDPNIRRLKNFLQSGALGRMTTVACDFYIGAHFGGFRDHMQHVLLLDMAIHTFDAARLITGADPLSVFCHEWNPPGSWYDHDASAIAIFCMSDDIVYSYRGSWCSEGLNTTWECEWRVIGEEGSVIWDGAQGFRAEVVAKRGGFRSEMRSVEVPPFDAGDKVGGHAGNIREFVRCVRGGAIPETVCTDNIKSLAMVFGAIESASLQRAVQIGL